MRMPALSAQLVGGVLAPSAALAVYLLGPAEDAPRAGLAIFTLIGILWLTQALPLTLTALLVPVCAVLSGLLSVQQALAPFAHPIIFLFLGGFALAAALSRHGLDRLLAHRVMALAGGHRLRAHLLLFVLVAALSMWISNTAAAVMALPLALGLLPAAADARERTFVLLGVAYSANIGGIGTLVGSPPNAIAAAQAGIGFAEWMRFGVPAVLLLLPLMVGVLWLRLRPPIVGEAPAVAEQHHTWTPSALLTLGLFACAVLAWVFGAPLGRLIGVAGDIDALIALAVLIALVAGRAVDWKDVERQTEWGVLLLFGGGLALGAVLGSSGASRYLSGTLLGVMAEAPGWLIVLGVVAFVVMLTELVSNTAAAALLVPLLVALAPDVGLDPRGLAVAVAISASCAFMLPVATPPNALVFGTGAVAARDMMWCGLLLNLVCIVVISALVGLL
jgi:sodium-dependent dicarboxylate transporter 2/3/5